MKWNTNLKFNVFYTYLLCLPIRKIHNILFLQLCVQSKYRKSGVKISRCFGILTKYYDKVFSKKGQNLLPGYFQKGQIYERRCFTLYELRVEHWSNAPALPNVTHAERVGRKKEGIHSILSFL